MNPTPTPNVTRDTAVNHAVDMRDFAGIPSDIVSVGMNGGPNGQPMLLNAVVYDEAVRQCPAFARLPYFLRVEEIHNPRDASANNGLLRVLARNRADEVSLKWENRALIDGARQCTTVTPKAEVHHAPKPGRRVNAVAAAVTILTTPKAA